MTQPDAGFGVSNYAYWLIRSPEPARAEVEIFSQWIIREVQLADMNRER